MHKDSKPKQEKLNKFFPRWLRILMCSLKFSVHTEAWFSQTQVDPAFRRSDSMLVKLLQVKIHSSFGRVQKQQQYGYTLGMWKSRDFRNFLVLGFFENYRCRIFWSGNFLFLKIPGYFSTRIFWSQDYPKISRESLGT